MEHSRSRLLSVRQIIAGALASAAGFFGIPIESSAQCMNPIVPSCGVYTSCFAKFCDCRRSPDEYFLSFGNRYCERFLDEGRFSQVGKEWRDSTLRCLQEKIVPHLDLSTASRCDCSKMREIAFESHVSCYTQPGKSVCDLPIADLGIIGQTVEARDAFSRDGWRTFLQIARKCMSSAGTVEKRSRWKRIADAVATY